MKKIKDILLEDNNIPQIVTDKADEAFAMIKEMRELDGEEQMMMRNTIKKQGKRTGYQYRFRYAKAAAAAVCAALLLGTSAYAAQHYWNLSSYMKKQNPDVSQEAVEKLIDTEVSQKALENKYQLVDFVVQEALTDGDTVYLTVEAKAGETGKYLLMPEGAEEDLDKLSYMGFDSDLTISEYAKEQGLEILRVGSSISYEKNSLNMDSQSIDCKYEDTDKLLFFISGQKEKKGDNLKASVINTVLPLSKGSDEVIRSEIDFTLKNKSKVDGKAYCMEQDTKIDGTTIEVTDLKVEETDLASYVTIQFTQDEQEIMDKGTVFRLKDSEGRIIESSEGGGAVQIANGRYQSKLQYNKGVLPDAFIMEVFDCELDGKPVYDEIQVKKQ